LSDAVAFKVTVPVTVDPGLVKVTVGDEVSLKTDEENADDVVEFPAASYARAVIEYVPLPTDVVSHETEYGEELSEPMSVAS
jgi:hypothetical protein